MIFFLLKTIILVIWLIIIRGTLPRYKIDLLIINSWKVWVFIMLLFFIFLLDLKIFFF